MSCTDGARWKEGGRGGAKRCLCNFSAMISLTEHDEFSRGTLSADIVSPGLVIRPVCGEISFIDYVNSNPIIKVAMHNPVIATLASEIFRWSKNTESTPPTTMTQLYTAFTCKLLTQHLSGCKEEAVKIGSLEEIPANKREKLLEICRLAWEGTVDKQLAFNSDTVGGDTLGLMYGIRNEKEGSEISYRFIHATLQEFLSAYHITQLPLELQESIIRTYDKTGQLHMVIKFYFGLTVPNPFTMRTISEHLSRHEQATVYHWLFETVDIKKVAKEIGSERIVKVYPPFSSWSPADYFVLGCSVASCSFQWELDFSKAFMKDEGMKMLCKGIASRAVSNCKGKIDCDFTENSISLEGIKCFANIPIQVAQKIHSIDFTKNELCRDALNAFCKVVPKLASLQVLSLWRNPVYEGGAVEVLKCLHQCKTPLRALDLSATGVGEEDCKELALVIANTDLEFLDVSLNNLSSSSVASILYGLLQNSTVQDLNIDHSHFSEENCSLFGLLLQQPSALKEVHMNNCLIDDEGIPHLREGRAKRHHPLARWGLPCHQIHFI